MSDRILLVDDELHIRLLLEQSLSDLEDRGVELHKAADGNEALALYDTLHPRLIILDVMMPGPNGFEVCRQIRSRPDSSATHIIILTAKGQETDRERGLQAGADSYMTKPFDPDALLSRAYEVLGMTP